MPRREQFLLVLSLATFPAVFLGGCTLIDQRTFEPRPLAAPPAPAPLPADLALVTIRLGTPRHVYVAPLARAVHAALAQKPDAAFLVELALPEESDPAQAAAVATAMRGQATAVMAAIVADGVPARRVRLMARGVPGAAPGEIRVHVR